MSILSVNRNSTVKLVKQIESELNEYRTQNQSNKYIRAVYKYDEINTETKCIIGEEETCTELTEETYEPGTIVKYRVNDTEDKFFYVIQDNGDTLTLIQRENTSNGTKWVESGENKNGPLTAISKLNEVTESWNNVNDQTYQIGTTIFYDNANTSCDTTSCVSNSYTLEERTTKARLITYQEVQRLGCNTTGDKSCPVWLYNYLNGSTSYGGTNDGAVYCYWTINTYNGSVSDVWGISYNGTLYRNNAQAIYGVRAVVVVNK